MKQQPFDKDLFIGNSDDFMTDDEIDKLFLQLDQIEPPTEVIENILNTVSRLPLPQYLSEEDIEDVMRSAQTSQSNSEDSLPPALEIVDDLVARYPHLQPS